MVGGDLISHIIENTYKTKTSILNTFHSEPNCIEIISQRNKPLIILQTAVVLFNKDKVH